MQVQLEATEALDPDEELRFRQEMSKMDKPFLRGAARGRRRWLVARDAVSAALGAARLSGARGWLILEQVWIQDEGRRDDIATPLLAAVEEQARQQGFSGVQTFLHSFHDVGFFLRRGYAQVGALAGDPPGHARLWLAKSFVPAAAGEVVAAPEEQPPTPDVPSPGAVAVDGSPLPPPPVMDAGTPTDGGAPSAAAATAGASPGAATKAASGAKRAGPASRKKKRRR